MNVQKIYSPENLLNKHYENLNTHFDSSTKTLWCYMKSYPRPCFTPDLLKDMHSALQTMCHPAVDKDAVKYLVAASAIPGVFNLGGDLDHFSHCIETQNEELLRKYAYSCVDLSLYSINQFDRDITSIALVQGNALGGGFEAALSCNVLVAEKSTKLGFPEIMFNLFPGMGAYSFLSRRVSMQTAEEMISSGKSYSAEELYQIGIIDVLADDGDGELAVRQYIKQHQKKQSARVAMHKARMRVNPVTKDELYEITDIWVNAALNIDRSALKVMQRLIRAQTHKMKNIEQLLEAS